jgi:hypothetical protein
MRITTPAVSSHGTLAVTAKTLHYCVEVMMGCARFQLLALHPLPRIVGKDFERLELEAISGFLREQSQP